MAWILQSTNDPPPNIDLTQILDATSKRHASLPAQTPVAFKYAWKYATWHAAEKTATDTNRFARTRAEGRESAM